MIDHKSLKWVLTQDDLDMQQRQWVEFLKEISFNINFCLGKQNQAAIAPSKRVVALAISLVNSTLLEEVQQNILKDKFFGPLIQEIQEQKDWKHLEEYTFKEGLLFFRNKICVLASLTILSSEWLLLPQFRILDSDIYHIPSVS